MRYRDVSCRQPGTKATSFFDEQTTCAAETALARARNLGKSFPQSITAKKVKMGEKAENELT